jgi:hypothetical protein
MLQNMAHTLIQPTFYVQYFAKGEISSKITPKRTQQSLGLDIGSNIFQNNSKKNPTKPRT